MGQKDGEKWTAAVALQPTHPQDRQAPRPSLSWLALSCRWPGTPFESEAVDALAQHMLAHVKHASQPAEALVMLGDQIYADATANLFNTRETDEVLAGMYRDAWGAPHTKALLSCVPSYTVIDDHEYHDNWSGASDPRSDASLVDGFEAAFAYQWRWHDANSAGWRSTPRIGATQVSGLWHDFTVGDVPFFAADTRSERELRTAHNWRTCHMLGPAQLQAIQEWLLAHRDQPKVLCSGSVFGFVERDAYETPGKCRSADSWHGYPHTWQTLVRFIVAEQIRHLVFLSGDYHFSALSKLVLHGDGSQPPVHALALACSGWNATLPFANSVPQEFIMGQSVDYPLSNATARVVCNARPLSTALRQFAKLTLDNGPDADWRLSVQVFDATGQVVAHDTQPL